MPHESEDSIPPRSRASGPAGLGEQAAAALGEGLAAGECLGELAAQERLRRWAEKAGCIIPEPEWLALRLISSATAEHEVRYRVSDHRAVKRTWPDTFGFVPALHGETWRPRPASATEYLLRQRLQNELFNDDIRLEGLMLSEGPSMIIGQPSGGISLVISQPWIEAADPSAPHPSEPEIAGFMRTMGFTPLIASLFGWIHQDAGYVILDAKPVD